MNKILLVLTALFFFCSCDSEEPAATKTNLEYLVGEGSNAWILESGIVSVGESSIDIFTSQSECDLDNLLILNDDYTYELNEGETKCNSNDPQNIFQANWSLEENDTVLKVDKFVFGGRSLDNATFKLSEVSENSFKGATQVTYNSNLYDADLVFVKSKQE